MFWSWFFLFRFDILHAHNWIDGEKRISARTVCAAHTHTHTHNPIKQFKQWFYAIIARNNLQESLIVFVHKCHITQHKINSQCKEIWGQRVGWQRQIFISYLFQNGRRFMKCIVTDRLLAVNPALIYTLAALPYNGYCCGRFWLFYSLADSFYILECRSEFKLKIIMYSLADMNWLSSWFALNFYFFIPL